ncbi:serine/threonine-protein kinase [Mycobacterium szulgai]|nr:serine/threonine-protein kinase [Mycobacterium szulgai]
MLGALAIIIAVLIVINSGADNPQQQQPPTVTDTGGPPATKTPSGQGPAFNWTDGEEAGIPGRQKLSPADAPLTLQHPASLARYEITR